MINAQTLALDSLSSEPHLPLFWRLGKLNTGQPLLWPITYQQAMVVPRVCIVVSCPARC